MENFVIALRMVFKVILFFVCLACFIHGLDELRNGGGALAGLALLSAIVLFVFDRERPQPGQT